MTQLAIYPEARIRRLESYNTDHHAPAGYRNTWSPIPPAHPLKTVSWLAGRALRSRVFEPTPWRELFRAEFEKPVKRYRVFALGHATTLIQLPGRWILTDPVFSSVIGPFEQIGARRFTRLPIAPDNLPPIDTVLISHDHYDHLDRASVLWLEERFRPRFYVARGLRSILESWGVARVIELDWRETIDSDDLQLYCLPARHFSGRGVTDRNTTLWSSFAIEEKRKRSVLYFAGDTGYGPHFAEIRALLPRIDLALMPIGAYLPRWLMEEVHTTPAEAVQAFVDLGAERFFAIHWGVFDLADEPLHAPPALAREAAARLGVDPGRLLIPDVGESVEG